MTTTKRKPPLVPPVLYTGATTCDFVPEWKCVPGDDTLLSLLKSCHAADLDEMTPLLVLADLLGERDDPREQWVRTGVKLWEQARTLKPGRKGWEQTIAKAALEPACKTVAGWRLACMWGHLVAWHSPAGWGKNIPQGKTWRDARVGIVSRSVWWWSMGLLEEKSQAYAAGRQADAAGRQKAVWRFARSLWELCVAKLPLLEVAK